MCSAKSTKHKVSGALQCSRKPSNVVTEDVGIFPSNTHVNADSRLATSANVNCVIMYNNLINIYKKSKTKYWNKHNKTINT